MIAIYKIIFGRRMTRFIFAVLGLGLARTGCAADWPAYRGPAGNGVSVETLDPSWPAEGPKRVWRADLHNGFSSFSGSGSRVFTLVTRGQEGVPPGTCVGLDAAAGKENCGNAPG